MEAKGYVVDPKLADEALGPFADGLMRPEEHNAVIETLTFGLHESTAYLEVVKSGIVALEGQRLEVLLPTVLAQGFFMGMKYCEVRDAEKISGEEEYRAAHDPSMAEMIPGHGRGCVCMECCKVFSEMTVGVAPPKPHIRRVGKILREEKPEGKPQ